MYARKLVRREETLVFQDAKKPAIPYVVVRSGDITLNMIVDSGCGVSIIDQKILDSIPHEKTDDNISLTALTPDSMDSDIVVVPITINKKQLSQKFAVYESDDIANFRALYGISIQGILGSDFMEATGCKVDYSKHALIIPSYDIFSNSSAGAFHRSRLYPDFTRGVFGYDEQLEHHSGRY